MSANPERYDIFIVGGGPAGLTLGAALVTCMPDLRIGMADRRHFSVPNDARSFALAAGVTRIYEALGLWERMLENASPISHMRITDSGEGDLSRPTFLSFSGDVLPGRPYAYMVPNRDLTRVLIEAADDCIDYYEGEELAGFSVEGQSGVLSFASGLEVRSALVVGADGAMSKLRQLVGIETIDHDYGQSGLVTTIAHSRPHDETAFEHFRPAGPFASLPLSGNRSSLVWTEHSERVEAIKAMNRDEQARLIEAETGMSLGSVEVLEPIQAFPLRLKLARSMVAERVALVADAAHVVHPIAGQGLNLGLEDVAQLVETVIEAVRLGQDHGAMDVLKAYEKARRTDIALMAAATDGLNRLFSNDVPPIRALRDFGLSVVDRIGPVKTQLIRHAAAASSGSPKLMQGRLV